MSVDLLWAERALPPPDLLAWVGTALERVAEGADLEAVQLAPCAPRMNRIGFVRAVEESTEAAAYDRRARTVNAVVERFRY